ncbi:MAG: trimeric intracellular cation channel family protein [Lentisphaeria bacterium]|nr:trimeric intracellular cation channel family protein [Lentisphaeria bacterium]
MEKEIILSLDIFGTAIFAATGAIKGVRRRLDIFGVTVLACCVGVGGGITRDAILGAVPAAALQNWSYLGVSIAVALIIFFSVRFWMKLRNIIQICDAVGLGVFTAIGAAKGMSFEVSFIGILLCGVITAIGGGIIRDILVREIPVVLRSDFYATASLLGGTVYYCLAVSNTNWFLNFLITSTFVFSIRFLAMHYKLQLPEAHVSLKKFFPPSELQKK